MLNHQQQCVHDAALANLRYSRKQVFEYSGRSGTGKSYTLFEICTNSGIPMERILPMAYTGAAAAVLRTKGFPHATTLHAGLYDAKEIPNPLFKKIKKASKMNHQFGVPDVPPTITKFVPKQTLPGIDLIVVDEGFMCPYHMKREIEKFGIPVIVTGDMRQLGPIGDKPAYLIDPSVPELTELMRQDANSPIIYIANRILNDEPIHCGCYGNKVLVLEEDQITGDMLKSADLTLCGTNATRDKWNNFIRKKIWGFDTTLPMYGERMICRQNHHGVEMDGVELANGLLGYAVSSPDVSDFNGKTFLLDFLPDMIYRPFRNLVCDYEYFSAPSLERVKYNNPYAVGERFEFAYCITTHLSQGSEANRGIYFHEEMGGGVDMQKRLAYTGVTRFKDCLIYVKPRRRFF